MESVIQDLHFSLRMLIRRPGFSAVVILALSLGIGATTAIFSVANSVILNPLPYENPDKLVSIREPKTAKQGDDAAWVPAQNFYDWRQHSQSFIDMASMGFSWAEINIGGEMERIHAIGVTHNYFSLLGVKPLIGRTFLPEDEQAGNNPIILSSGFWERWFGANPDVIGTTMLIYEKPYTIIGVIPADFTHALPEEIPRDICLLTPVLNSRPQKGSSTYVIARLKPEVSPGQAQAELEAISRGLNHYHEAEAGARITVIPLHEVFVGDIRPAINILLGVVCVLLLIACANVANLLLARNAARQKEFAIRASLGAGRRRLIQQLLTESVLMALVGGVLGVLFAHWGLKLLVAIGPENIPRLQEIRIDSRVLLFTLVTSILSGVLLGLIPALQTAKEGLNATLKEGSGNTSARLTSKRWRYALASLEVALSLILLISAGLLVKSFVRLRNVELGFNPDRILMVTLMAYPAKYKTTPEVNAFFEEFISKVEALPGVEEAAAVDVGPLVGANQLIPIEIEGKPKGAGEQTPDADYRMITPGYFDVIGTPLVGGRRFDEQDHKQSQPVIMINQAMAKRYWPGQNPIGERILVNIFGKSSRTIVGIVGDIRNNSRNTDPYPQIYLPLAQTGMRAMGIMIRTTPDPLTLVPAVKGVAREVSPDHPLSHIMTMEKWASRAIARPRFNTTLILIFAAVALLLASVGLYGVIAYSVAQRTHEIGVRMALGCTQGGILRLIIGQGLAVTLIGVGAGLAGAFALTRIISSLLFGVTPTDVMVFAGCSLLILIVALLATYVPALRATRVDPIIALRYE